MRETQHRNTETVSARASVVLEEAGLDKALRQAADRRTRQPGAFGYVAARRSRPRRPHRSYAKWPMDLQQLPITQFPGGGLSLRRIRDLRLTYAG